MIRRSEDIVFTHSYAELPGVFHSFVQPTPVRNPRLVAFDEGTAADLGWSADIQADPQFVAWASGSLELPASRPLAMVYAGHQFGVYVPQLGDGRALLLGEVPGADGELRDVQLKGAGVTPYSRDGDGRAVLRSVVREYLAGIAMRGLGIASTGALAIIGSDEPVQRETMERAAILIRVARSHVRFGHFEYFYYRERVEDLRQLADYVIRRHFPSLAAGGDAVTHMFHEVCGRTAELIARWMAYGFQHGVMNTDNMSIVGDTLDYGPYGFMDAFDPAWICNHSDHTGRYAFMQQPGIGLWNLGRLARALTPLAGEEDLVAGLESYQARVAERHLALMRERLGLCEEHPDDAELITDLFSLMHRHRVDHTNCFRGLCEFVPGERCPAVRDRFADLPAIDAWLQRYAGRLGREQATAGDRRRRMLSANPKFILRNHVAQQVIESVQSGDNEMLRNYARVLAEPGAEWPEHAVWAADAPDWARQLEISCSS